ncbi:MAG: hypothetical protein NPIRA02_40310 [Nitrospirales bacterium]|nr:MAG: hypothetical protein NPIRA02_40310 [Nitrospirales bacterium]
MTKEQEGTQKDEIQALEVKPDDSWFIEANDYQGNTVVYLRVQVTGLLPRRAGPFSDRETAVLALASLLSDVIMDIDCEWSNDLNAYVEDRPFQHRSNYVQAEDELGQAYLQQIQAQSINTPMTHRRNSKKAVV